MKGKRYYKGRKCYYALTEFITCLRLDLWHFRHKISGCSLLCVYRLKKSKFVIGQSVTGHLCLLLCAVAPAREPQRLYQ